MVGRPVAWLFVGVLFLVSCGSGDDAGTGGGPATTGGEVESDRGDDERDLAGPATTETGAALVVTRDVRFATDAPDLASWSAPLFDVYSPRGAVDRPLVVVLPPHALTKENPASVQLATAIAEDGMVAVVVNWTELDQPVGFFQDPATFADVTGADQSVAGCAVSSAVSQAGEYGADASRLVLVGELFGANIASMVALGAPDPLPGCVATDVTWSASGFVGLNGDWMVGFPMLDPVAEAAVETLSPWSVLDQAPHISTVLTVTDHYVNLTRNCGDPMSWLASRDPTGSMSAQLDALDAGADGCIDATEQVQATAAEMSSHGLEVEVATLTNSDAATRSDAGSHVLEFGPADLARLRAAITSVAG